MRRGARERPKHRFRAHTKFQFRLKLLIEFGSHVCSLHPHPHPRRIRQQAHRTCVPSFGRTLLDLGSQRSQARPRHSLASLSQNRLRLKAASAWVLGACRQDGGPQREAGCRASVFRNLRHEACPERERRADAGSSLLDPWQDAVLGHWNSGRRDGRGLFRTLRQQGYRGSYATLSRYLHRLRRAGRHAGA